MLDYTYFFLFCKKSKRKIRLFTFGLKLFCRYFGFCFYLYLFGKLVN
nr:MAG TPA: hypothetical protein [Caudoviricetes sp.]